MNPHIIKIKEALNKAYLKLPPTRSQIEAFKTNLIIYLNRLKLQRVRNFIKMKSLNFLRKHITHQIIILIPKVAMTW